MIYILPTSHDIQHGILDSAKPLLDHITKLIEKYSIDFIAEEIHPDELLGDSISPIGRFAHDNDLFYVYLDPSGEQEKELGVLSSDTYYSETDEIKKKEILLIRARKRENYWLPSILKINKTNKNILLVCGVAHVSKNPDSSGKGIDRLLRENEVQLIILDNFISHRAKKQLASS